MWEIGNETTLSADIGNKDRIYQGQRMPTLKDVGGFFDDVAQTHQSCRPAAPGQQRRFAHARESVEPVPAPEVGQRHVRGAISSVSNCSMQTTRSM